MTHQEELITVIGNLPEPVFTTNELIDLFPDTNPSALSASICNLVSAGLLWRVGRRAINGKSFMFYTRDKAKANPEVNQPDRTELRGREADKRVYEEQIAELKAANRKLRKRVAYLERKLQTILNLFPKDELVKLVSTEVL